MGRKKIRIESIENDRQKLVTFTRRRAGIIKKAHELSVLCDCKVVLMMFDEGDNCHLYSSDNADELIEKYRCREFRSGTAKKMKLSDCYGETCPEEPAAHEYVVDQNGDGSDSLVVKQAAKFDSPQSPQSVHSPYMAIQQQLHMYAQPQQQQQFVRDHTGAVKLPISQAASPHLRGAAMSPTTAPLALSSAAPAAQQMYSWEMGQNYLTSPSSTASNGSPAFWMQTPTIKDLQHFLASAATDAAQRGQSESGTSTVSPTLAFHQKPITGLRSHGMAVSQAISPGMLDRNDFVPRCEFLDRSTEDVAAFGHGAASKAGGTMHVDSDFAEMLEPQDMPSLYWADQL